MSNRNFFGLLFLAVIVYALNLRLDVMLIDAAQYAEMSWEMLTTHSFLKLHCLTREYLDKPPLIFWLGSLSYLVFGFNNFAYKLPSFLFALLAIFSTYRLTKIYYPEKTARMAAVMLATTQALFLITNDVRTDTLLMGAVIFSIWQWAVFFEEGKPQHLLLASFGLGLALLAKGPIGAVATGAALLPHLLLKGHWKKILDIRLIFTAVIIAILLTPMCIGLYQQYGLKGLRFYFWTQSFGRITGESEWNNHPDTFFLLHTTAWAFLPWSLFLLIGWAGALVRLVRKEFQPELISVSGFTLVSIMLSLSKYQLPHYIFVVYPLAAIMAANGFLQLTHWPKARPWLTALQLTMLVALVPFSGLLQYLLIGLKPVPTICMAIVFPLAIWAAAQAEGGLKTFYNVSRYVSFRFHRFYHGIFGGKSETQLTLVFGLDVLYRKLFFLSALIFIAFNFLLSVFYFPAILKYQPQGDFGRYVTQHPGKFACYESMPDYPLVFYAKQLPPAIWGKADFKKMLDENQHLLVYAPPNAVRELDEEHIAYKIIDERLVFGVANLSAGFLNPATRASVCGKMYLLEVKR